MTAEERRELELRFKSELKQVKALRNRIESSTRQEKASVPSSNGNVNKPYSTRKTGTKLKLPVVGRKPGRPRQDSITKLFKQCKLVLKNLMSRKYAWIFNTPVDPKNLNIPDYFEIIKHPMDLGTIKANLDSDSYPCPRGFAADVRLTFINAKTYNPTGNDVHKMADTMSEIFEAKWKHIEKELIEDETMARLETEPAKTFMQSVKQSRKSEDLITTTMIVETDEPVARRGTVQAKTSMQSVEQSRKSQGPIQTTMTIEERERLISCLESLRGELPDNISIFITGHMENGNHPDQGEIEIHIHSFSDDRWFELQKLFNDHVGDKRMQQLADVCEVEVLKASGLNISRIPHCKGNEPADEGVGDGGNNPSFSNNSLSTTENESSSRCKHFFTVLHTDSEHTDEDVEIGGNNTLMPANPPIVVEKESQSKSKSSSDSDSSSSESSSSSKSYSNDTQTKDNKCSIEPDAVIDHSPIDATNAVAINKTVSGLDKSEHDVYTKSAYVDMDGPQDGANSPSEKQISGEKFKGGSLMRNCFADRILNDREKTPDKCEGHEWKQRKAEKAQIQVGVNASEEASGHAEAKAAAEPKLKLQHEREAAYQALLKMKKTVEINENSAIFEDFVKLTGVEGFKFRESYPLEHLDLFIKEDGEEEESEPGNQ